MHTHWSLTSNNATHYLNYMTIVRQLQPNNMYCDFCVVYFKTDATPTTCVFRVRVESSSNSLGPLQPKFHCFSINNWYD